MANHKRSCVFISALFAAAFAVSDVSAVTVDLPDDLEWEWDDIGEDSDTWGRSWDIVEGESLVLGGVRFTCAAAAFGPQCHLQISRRDLSARTPRHELIIATLASDSAPSLTSRIPSLKKSRDSSSPLMFPVDLPYDHRLDPATLTGAKKGNKTIKRYKIREGESLDLGRVRFYCTAAASDSCTLDIFKRQGTVYAHAWKSAVETVDLDGSGWGHFGRAQGHDKLTVLVDRGRDNANDPSAAAKTAVAIRRAAAAGRSFYGYETTWLEVPQRIGQPSQAELEACQAIPNCVEPGGRFTRGRSLVTISHHFRNGDVRVSGDPELSERGRNGWEGGEDDGSTWLPSLRAGDITFRGIEMSDDAGGSRLHVNMWAMVNRNSKPHDTDYQSFGYWMRTDNLATPGVDETAVGVFASSNSPYRYDDHLQGLTGSATYKGPAAGLYSRTGKTPIVDSFRGRVTLTADFGTANEFGTVLGQVHDIVRRDGQYLGEIGLGEAAIRAFEDAGVPMMRGLVSRDGESRAGSWEASFFGGADRSSDSAIEPSSIGGTFRVKDGKEAFAGAFGAFHEDHLSQ